MAGSLSAEFEQDILNWVQNSTAAPTAPSTDLWSTDSVQVIKVPILTSSPST